MSANFYKESVGMLGFDPHPYWTFPLLEVTTIHVVPVWSLGSQLDDEEQKTATVTAEGEAMLKGGATRIVALHVPIPPAPPNPVAETLQLASILSDSEIVAEMSVHKVTGEGTELATCIYESFGLNVDCGDPITVPFGITFYHSNSVKTQPTPGDYAGAVAGWLGGALVDYLGDAIGGDGFVGDLQKAIFEEILRALDLDIALDELPSPDKIHHFVQHWIDDGFDEAKKQWQEDVRKDQEKRAEDKADPEKQTIKERIGEFLEKLGAKKAGGKKGKR